MTTVFTGLHTTVLMSADGMTFTVKHGPKKAHRKTFKGESAWSAVNRFCWDAGDLTCNV
jgi:hypothetical protein